MESDETLSSYRVAVEVALRDLCHIDAHVALEEFDPAFTVSGEGWTVASVTVRAASRAEARRTAAAVVVSALEAEPLFLWLH